MSNATRSALVAVTAQNHSPAVVVGTLGGEQRDEEPMDDERWLTVGIPGLQTGLVLEGGSIVGDLTPDGNTVITLAPTDIGAKDDRLGGTGVVPTESMREMPWVAAKPGSSTRIATCSSSCRVVWSRER